MGSASIQTLWSSWSFALPWRMKFREIPFVWLLLGLVLSSCESVSVDEHAQDPHYDVVRVEEGIASWYSVKTNRGTRTASGRRFCEDDATAAHKKLPFGTKVRVTNLRNNQSAIVTITDRGPFIRGRIIDVTTSVAKRIGFYSRGLTPCKVEVLELRESHAATRRPRLVERSPSGRR